MIAAKRTHDHIVDAVAIHISRIGDAPSGLVSPVSPWMTKPWTGMRKERSITRDSVTVQGLSSSKGWDRLINLLLSLLARDSFQ